jgi:hypothetical protein
MSSMICPLAFIIAMIMPFIMNIIPQFVGFDLPHLTVDFSQNSFVIIIIVGVFRMAPIIGMIVFCLKGNMYVEFLREKWFLILVSLGGGLGSITWLTTGILLNLNYMIDFRHSTLQLALHTFKDVLLQSFGGNIFKFILGDYEHTLGEFVVNEYTTG